MLRCGGGAALARVQAESESKSAAGLGLVGWRVRNEEVAVSSAGSIFHIWHKPQPFKSVISIRSTGRQELDLLPYSPVPCHASLFVFLVQHAGLVFIQVPTIDRYFLLNCLSFVFSREKTRNWKKVRKERLQGAISTLLRGGGRQMSHDKLSLLAV